MISKNPTSQFLKWYLKVQIVIFLVVSFVLGPEGLANLYCNLVGGLTCDEIAFSERLWWQKLEKK